VFAFIIAGAVLVSAAGGATGYVIGLIAPRFVRSTFGARPDSDAAHRGFGMGLTWGFIVGIAAGGLAFDMADAASMRRRGGASDGSE
jgi:hypothetical protein